MTTGFPTGLALLAWCLTTLALSALVTALTIRYARHRRMVDMPGQRRSHRQPTPRGGGFGIVFSVMVGVLVPLAVFAPHAPVFRLALVASAALLLVATVGWIDDHGGLRARYRFTAHCIAAVLVLAAMPAAPANVVALVDSFVDAGMAINALVITLVGIAIVWSVNLHNFMDGINGLLASQSIFVLAALASIGVFFGSAPAWVVGSAMAAAVVGFLPFNFPKARVFMGDVGSGALGLLVAMAVLYQLGDAALDPVTGLIACSAFVTDATATLLSRMLRGRRWYDAHREHLYQGLVRSGYSHAHVVVVYMAWNLLVAVPAMLLIQTNRSAIAINSLSHNLSAQSVWTLLGVYALALLVWCLGKRFCLRRIRAKDRHEFA